jgi:hypothetical protein
MDSDNDMPLLEIKGLVFPYSIPVYNWPCEQDVCWDCAQVLPLKEHTVLWHITTDKLCYVRLFVCETCSTGIKPEAWSADNMEEDPYWSKIVKDIHAKKMEFNMKTLLYMLRSENKCKSLKGLN